MVDGFLAIKNGSGIQMSDPSFLDSNTVNHGHFFQSVSDRELKNTMRLHKNKPFWIAGSLAALIFIFLFMGRLDLFENLFNRPKTLSISAVNTPHDKETWMNIFQGVRKIGFSHARLSSENDGYRLEETVRMRINTIVRP